MKDFTAIVPRRDGAFPELWEALAEAAIPVESAVSFSREHHRVVHVVVDDAFADRTRSIIEHEVGMLVVDVRDVIVTPLDAYPGGLAEITRLMHDANAGVYLMSLASENRVMFGVADRSAAEEVLRG